jgi:hypothetical protein
MLVLGSNIRPEAADVFGQLVNHVAHLALADGLV